MKFVLDNAEKFKRLRGLGIIVNGQLINIADLLIKPFLAGTNIPDAFQHVIEIVGTNIDSRLEPLIIHGKTFDHILIQTVYCPFAELRTARRPHAKANSHNQFEIIKLYAPRYLPSAFFLNY